MVSSLVSFLTLFLAIIACSDGKTKEKLIVHNCSAEENGHFHGLDSTVIYYHIVDTNHSSCMHFVWSTVQHPTLYLSHTPDTNNSCSCKAPQSRYDPTYPYDQNGTVSIPGLESPFSLAITFTRLVEFDATDDNLAQEALNLTEVCSDNNDTSECFTDLGNSSGITWTFLQNETTFVGKIKHIVQANNHSSKFTEIRIRTKIPEFVKKNRLEYFPKTLFTENSTTFDLVIKDYVYHNCSNKRGRLALETVVIHGRNVNSGNITIKRTTDDEYTPSVFSTYTYNTSSKSNKSHSSNKSSLGGYIQWKPISYQSSSRKSTSSQQVFVQESGSYEACQLHQVPLGLASALYGTNADDITEMGSNVTRWFVVFGTSGDNNNLNSPYNTWTVVTGYGDVPMDTFSSVIIITIIVGVGIPAALVVVGGVYVIIRKKPWQNVQRLMNSRNRGYSRLS